MSSTAYFDTNEQAWFVDVTADKVTPTTQRFALVDKVVETYHSGQINDLTAANTVANEVLDDAAKVINALCDALAAHEADPVEADPLTAARARSLSLHVLGMIASIRGS